MQSAELLASIVAERIVDRLEASGYVVMQGSPAPGGLRSAAVMRADDGARVQMAADAP